MAEQTKVTTLEKVVIRFSGDSGDGMQLTGTIFSNLSAIFGNEISTFPDYPAEVRAPQGTLSGVSGFQVHLGSRKIFTPGDKADVLVAMNPAALKVNVKNLKPNAIVLIDTDSFQKSDLDKAQFTTDDPFQELGLGGVQVVAAPISTMVKDGLAEFGLDNKSALRCKNMFALGLVCWLFERPLDEAMHMLQNKFAKKPAIAQANIKALTDGYNYGHNIHASVSTYGIETVCRSRSSNHDSRTFTVTSVKRLHQVGLFALGRHTRRRTTTLHINNNQRQFGDHGQTDRFALQRQTGTGCGSRSQATGKAGSDGSTDTGNFIFRLNSDDTKLLML